VAAAIVPVAFATGSDPVAGSLIASLNKPGGSLTGFTVISAALWPKRLELLRELISPTPVIAPLVNPNNVNTIPSIRELNDAARKIGQDVVVLNADAEREFEPVFASLTAKRASTLVVADDPLFSGRRTRLIDLAVRHNSHNLRQARVSGRWRAEQLRCQHGRPVLPMRDAAWVAAAVSSC